MNAQSLSHFSVFVVSLVSFAGIFALSLSEVRLRKLSTTLISFAAGSLLGDAFIRLAGLLRTQKRNATRFFGVVQL